MHLQLLVPLFMVCVSNTQTVNHKIGIQLCQLKCMKSSHCESVAYDIMTLAYQLLKGAAERQLKGYITFQKGKDMPSTGACSLKTCDSNTRCLETHQGSVACVYDYDDLTKAFKPSTDSPGKPANILNKECKRSQDCSSSNLQCVGGRCKCPLGLSFNPTNSTCVRRCKVYGNQSTMYQGYKTTVFSQSSFVMVSMSTCSIKCFETTTFTCLSFQYFPKLKMCQVHATGWLDAPSYKRKKGSNEWNFGTRNCA